MAKYTVEHEDLGGVIITAETNKPMAVDFGDAGKVGLSIAQAKALGRMLATAVRKTEVPEKGKAIVIKKRSPKVDK